MGPWSPYKGSLSVRTAPTRMLDPVPPCGGEHLCTGCKDAAVMSDHMSSQDMSLACLGSKPPDGNRTDLGRVLDLPRGYWAEPTLLGLFHSGPGTTNIGQPWKLSIQSYELIYSHLLILANTFFLYLSDDTL